MAENGALRAAEFQGRVLEHLQHLEERTRANSQKLDIMRQEFFDNRVAIESRMTAQETKIKGIAAVWAVIAGFVSSLVLAIVSKILLG